MSAGYATALAQSKLKSELPRRAIQFAECAIGILWLLGAFHYLRQGGRYAAILLVASCLLLVPRKIRLIRGLRMPATQTAPRTWLFLLALFLPEHLASGGTVVAPHLVPLCLAAICLLADMFVGGTATAETWMSLHHRASTALMAFIVVYGVATTALAILKLHAFGYVGQDIGYFMQCLYTGLHGQLFASNQYHDLLYTRTVTSDFAGHNQPILFLLLPTYWLYPQASMLFAVRNLCMALSAYPAYQLARCRLQPVPALAVTLALLLAPSVLFQNFYDYAPLTLAGLPLLFALLFYERRYFLPYVASVLLCLIVREDLALVVIGLALVALITRRERRWILIPGVIGIAWYLLTWEVILPHFQHGSVSAVESCFAYLGSSPGTMLHTMLVDPRLFFTHKATVYSKQLLTPFGLILPLFSPMALIVAPLYLINIVGDPGCNSAIIFRHYSLIPSILLYPGVIVAISGIPKVRNRIGIRTGTVALAILLASIGTTALSVGTAELGWWHTAPWQDEARYVAKQIPPTAAAAVPRYMLPLVANREKVYQSLRLLDYHHPDANIVVIDRNDQRMGVTPDWEPHYKELLTQLHVRRRFQLIYSSSNYQIYRLAGAPLQSLRPIPGENGQ